MNTEYYNINFIIPYLKYIIPTGIFFLVCFIFLFIIVSYFILKLLKSSIDNHNVLFYQYNKKSQQILNKYGNHKITKIYLVRQPFSKFITLLLNTITCFQYDKLIKESQDNFPYHSLLIFEIKMQDNKRKLLLLEKNSCINICENFFMHSFLDIKTIPIPISKEKEKDKYTMNQILNKTLKRVGSNKFFNWNLYKNNCQEFTKEILITMKKYNVKNKEFIFRDKLFNILIPSEFTLHVINCLCIIYNICEKYVYDRNYV
jgi:hypothetical protein